MRHCGLLLLPFLWGALGNTDHNKEKFLEEPPLSDDFEHLSIFPQNHFVADLTASPTISFAPTPSPTTTSPTPPIPTQKPTPGIYLDQKDINLAVGTQQVITGVLTIGLFVCMVLELLAPEVLFLIALIVLMLCQILSLSETLSGFANESMITIGTLFLVIGAVDKSHLVDYVARKAFGMTGSITFAKVRMLITCFCLSIFFNNIPLVAILMPIVKDWGRVRDVAASQLLIPLSYSVLAGSFVSMIGTSTNLTVQGLMQADRGYSFNFFAPAPIGIPIFFLLLAYQVFLGPYLLPHYKSGMLRAVRDQVESLVAEVYVSTNSIFIGQSLGLMMNSLGIAPSRAIKIRRRVTPRTEEEIQADEQRKLEREKSKRKELKKSQSSNVDQTYLQRFLPFWKKSLPDSNAESSPGDSDDYKAANAEEEEIDMESPPLLDPCEYRDLIAPSLMESLMADDIVFISSAQDVVEKLMKSIAGESKGYGTEICECVVSDSNPFLGRKISEIASLFSEKYKVGLIAVRSKDWNNSEAAPVVEDDSEFPNSPSSVGEPEGVELVIASKSNEGLEEDSTIHVEKSNTELMFEKMMGSQVSEHVLHYGDVVLCIANSVEVEKLRGNRDFFVISTVGRLPKPLDLWNSIAVVIFLAMMILVATERIAMCPAALTVTCVYFIGGWIKYDEIPRLINLRLLMLMGCSLSYARAVTKTGLALKIAASISSSNPSSFEAILFVYAITLVITELISNNAAAALMYPIAVALADELKLSFIPFAMTVLIASTAGFMSPIGYQTHLMVWGPGGYKFKDFLFFGFIPDIMYWIVACSLISVIYPFDKYP